jgi:DNA primase catalytic subunit
MTCDLIKAVGQLSARDPDMIVFSGKSGFHVYYWNWDDIPLRHEHPKQRIEAFVLSRKELLNALKSRGVLVDRSVTADPWRVLRLPGSLHWDTGFIARQVSELNQFRPERDAVAFPSESYERLFVKLKSDNTQN